MKILLQNTATKPRYVPEATIFIPRIKIQNTPRIRSLSFSQQWGQGFISSVHSFTIEDSGFTTVRKVWNFTHSYKLRITEHLHPLLVVSVCKVMFGLLNFYLTTPTPPPPPSPAPPPSPSPSPSPSPPKHHHHHHHEQNKTKQQQNNSPLLQF